MTDQADLYGKRTLDFIERLRTLDGYEDICRQVQTELEWYGFTYVSSWSIPLYREELHGARPGGH